MNKIILLVILFYTNSTSFSQTKVYHHKVAWGRLVLSDTIASKKWKWEFYLQQRTQDNGNANLFNERQFTSYWFWLNYQATKSLKVSLSPLGYFDTKILIVKPSDAEKPGVREFRWSLRLEQETKYRYFNLYNRYTLEYRQRDLTFCPGKCRSFSLFIVTSLLLL